MLSAAILGAWALWRGPRALPRPRLPYAILLGEGVSLGYLGLVAILNTGRLLVSRLRPPFRRPRRRFRPLGNSRREETALQEILCSTRREPSARSSLFPGSGPRRQLSGSRLSRNRLLLLGGRPHRSGPSRTSMVEERAQAKTAYLASPVLALFAIVKAWKPRAQVASTVPRRGKSQALSPALLRSVPMSFKVGELFENRGHCHRRSGRRCRAPPTISPL